MCDILCQFYFTMDYFFWICLVEFSLILRVFHVISGIIIILPSYSLQIGLAIRLYFHFPKVGIATNLLLLLYGFT